MSQQVMYIPPERDFKPNGDEPYSFEPDNTLVLGYCFVRVAFGADAVSGKAKAVDGLTLADLRVLIDGTWTDWSDYLIGRGLAKRYDGGKSPSWCPP